MAISRVYLPWLIGLAAAFFCSATFSAENPAGQNDSAILSNITTKLYGDRFFRPEKLAIKVQDAIVTLKGTVPSLRARDRAISLGESIRGVKGVIDQLSISVPKRTDEQIAHDAGRALLLDGATGNFEIHTRVNDGIVTILGKVDSWTERDLASWVVKGVRGVRGVDNELQLTSKERRPDREIAADVREALRLDPYLNDDALIVQVHHGMVSVKGEIDNINQERRIYEESLVRGVTGIYLPGLIVKPGGETSLAKDSQTYSDQTLRKNLRLAFLKDARLKKSPPKIHVYERVATLSGTVDNLKAKKVAEDDAKNIRGVAEVIDKIQVKPTILRNDSEIAADVQETLGLDPILDTSQVSCRVERGKVTLTGQAAGFYETWVAADDASRVKGVKDVKNQITVENIPSPQEPKSDFLIQSDLLMKLREDPDLNFADNIKVNVVNARAVLKGQVSSIAQVDYATRDALDSGARTVENDLKVSGKKGENVRIYSSTPLEFYSLTHDSLADKIISSPDLTQLSDKDIAERISRKFAYSMHLSPGHIKVTSKSGVVALTGTATSLRSKEQAVEFADGTRGVTAVIDELTIRPSLRTDDQILKDVRKSLTIDPAVRSFGLGVSVLRGVVSLKGRVDSWAAKNLAGWVVSGVKGVTDVDNEIEIVPERIFSDAEIANEVRDELKADPFINDKTIEIKVEDSKVTLSGVVPSLAQRSRVYRDALVAGVMSVDARHIEIKPEMTNLGPADKIPEDDVQIQAAASRALKLDPRLKNASVHVDVNGHDATLSGTVENYKSQMTAEEDVRNTLGVGDVNDRLFVKSRQIRPDQDILTDVNDVFAVNSLLDPFTIEATVKNGVVTLKGKVDTDYEKWDASEEISVIDGVKGIKNELGLYQPRPMKTEIADSTIRDTILADLQEDPNLNADDQVFASVKNGKATLYGNVSSWPDSFEAVEDAFMGGAIGVSNQIKIAGQKSLSVREYPGMPQEVYSYQWKPGDINLNSLKDQTLVSVKNRKRRR